MIRHRDYVPHGVIPAVLLPFNDDFSIDEASFRKHLRDIAAVEGLSAVTVNAHSTEVASCSGDEQHRVMEITGEEIGAKLPIIADESMPTFRTRADACFWGGVGPFFAGVTIAGKHGHACTRSRFDNGHN